MNKAVDNIFKIIAYPLLYLGLQIFVTFIYMFAVMIIAGINIGIEIAVSGGNMFSEADILETVMSQVRLSVPVILSAAACFTVIFAVLRKEWKAEKFWSVNKIKVPPVILCAALGIALNLFTVGFLTMLPLPEQEALDFMFDENLFIQLISIALLAPILEEIIFRGIVLKRLMKMTGLKAAVILQALLFGVIHLNITQGIYAFFLGIIIGLIYLWYDSIWAAVTVHAAFNATSVIIGYIAGDAEINTLVFLIMTASALAVSAGLILALSGKRTVKIIETAKTKSDVYNRWAY